MFESKQLIYIQMQKTGCTHIASLLSDLLDGQQIGKHNAASSAQLKKDKYMISSIRNPWDWYLSLWTFGVSGEGGLMNRLTKRYLRKSLKSAIKHPIKKTLPLIREIFKDIKSWQDVYCTNNDDINAFRNWLRRMHDPKNSMALGEGYGNTTIANICGFMSYRYLYLCCKNFKELKNADNIHSHSDISRFEAKNCYIDFFIHQENLENDLCRALSNINEFSIEKKRHIYDAQKTNTSRRILEITEYYNQESIELVQKRDKLLIDKFGYNSPRVA